MLFQDKSTSGRSSGVKPTKLVTLAWNERVKKEDGEVIQLPVPYELPPRPYSSAGLFCLSRNR